MISKTVLLIATLFVMNVDAFAPVNSYSNPIASTKLHMIENAVGFMDIDAIESVSTAVSSVIQVSPTMMISETEPWVQPFATVLGPFLNILSFAMLCRVVISWYPSANLNEMPYSLAAWPTEPFLRIIRGSVPPAFGVDITPIVWLAIFTFFNEILLGQQGLLTMKMKYGI